jgi:23S rRNA (cytosine1962-C5)-methyltransferase
MIVLKTAGWSDYELLDCGDGKRLERFGEYVLVRPDPQIIWGPKKDKSEWEKADAVFDGKWINKNRVPERWLLKYQDLSFFAKLSPFKHTGVFPEQVLNWEFVKLQITNAKLQMAREISVLNLFGYTGISSMVALSAGAKVTHVDSSRSSIGWMKENLEASGLSDKPIRYILDDVLKFVQREVKRGAKYDAIIMDPPIYGHGPSGETWDFNSSFPKLLKLCRQLLSDKPLFVLVNAYAISSSSIMLQNVLGENFSDLGGVIESGELALEEKDSGRLLSTGIFGRWSN